MTVSEYVERATCADPTAYITVADALARYRAEHPGFRRAQFVADLANGRYVLGVRPRDGQMVIVGRSWHAPKTLGVQNGRVVCSAAI